MFKKIDHVEIVPSNPEKTIRFYEILGFNLKSRHKIDVHPLKEVIYLELGGAIIEILNVEKPSANSREQWQVGYRGIAIEVENMDKTVNYLKTKGIVITWGPMDLGNSIRAEIKDPDNLAVELRQWK